MTARYQLSRVSFRVFRMLPAVGSYRLARAVSLLVLVCLLGPHGPAQGQIASDGVDQPLDFGDSSVPGIYGAVEPEVLGYESPGSHGFWDHGPGQCCGDCPPGWRVRADGLVLNLETDDGVTFSTAFVLNDVGYEEGGRVSLIRHWDCLDAWELAFVGPYEWKEFGEVNGVGLFSNLVAMGVDISEFNDATLHRQALRSRLNSFEVNRRWFGWDVISTLVGVRYLNVDDDLVFNSTGAGGAGLLAIETNNHMAGPQIGMELMFPLGNFMTTSTIKGAAMLNGHDANILLVNAGVTEIAAGKDDLDFASVVELGYLVSYAITPQVKLRGGYEFWWLYNHAIASAQITGPLTPNTGRGIRNKENVYYHGATAGVEVIW